MNTPNILKKRWIVVVDNETKPKGIKRHVEDMSIYTEDLRKEVVGCSEWMRAEVSTFEHIVKLHNESLEKQKP